MQSIKAIETRYKGYHFRSRLEARWAVFFDHLNMEWTYEPEGFEVTMGEGEYESTTRYLPDFRLKGRYGEDVWVEVKGSDDQLASDYDKLETMLDWFSPIPGISDSVGTDRGLLILGDIPEPRHGRTLHGIVQHDEGLYFNWAQFTENGIDVVNDEPVAWFFHEEDIGGIGGQLGKWTTKSLFIPTKYAYLEVVNAYAKARSARF